MSSPRSSPTAAAAAPANFEELPIEIGVESDDTDSSSIGSDFSETTSVSSSVFDYVYENGRRYASQRTGKGTEYLIPNDETEQGRLDLMHHMWNLLHRGNLFRANVEDAYKKKVAKGESFRVLDLGTGTGIWAIDFGDQYPKAEVIGVDLSPIQPHWVPPNVKFEVDNFEDEWVFRSKFDYIHGRNLTGSIKDPARLFKQIYDNLVPGGIVEICENHVTGLYSEDGTLKEDSALYKYHNLLSDIGHKVGQRMDISPEMKSYVENAGFQQVDEFKGKLPVGAWPKDEALKTIGLVAQEIVQTGVEAFGLAGFTRVLGWEPKKAKDFCEQVRADYNNRKIHKIYPIFIVHGTKPAGDCSDSE
ncbi:S-adenosyl-L-methionine-dependent methyltransferase [Ascobolus immersus RN42]|uniref:S-adenosyl-L-methionine-dependent methyltransferase n=1 Tax=Ascobolus immersus RN42 TaxID=1160509 RepID=A0A3N4HTU8_ASCIM|nr:S-adenosyl-L-methionine-dependent methyltransferase [Ascobolus immersus RN42]